MERIRRLFSTLRAKLPNTSEVVKSLDHLARRALSHVVIIAATIAWLSWQSYQEQEDVGVLVLADAFVIWLLVAATTACVRPERTSVKLIVCAVPLADDNPSFWSRFFAVVRQTGKNKMRDLSFGPPQKHWPDLKDGFKKWTWDAFTTKYFGKLREAATLRFDQQPRLSEGCVRIFVWKPHAAVIDGITKNEKECSVGHIALMFLPPLDQAGAAPAAAPVAVAVPNYISFWPVKETKMRLLDDRGQLVDWESDIDDLRDPDYVVELEFKPAQLQLMANKAADLKNQHSNNSMRYNLLNSFESWILPRRPSRYLNCSTYAWMILDTADISKVLRASRCEPADVARLTRTTLAGMGVLPSLCKPLEEFFQFFPIPVFSPETVFYILNYYLHFQPSGAYNPKLRKNGAPDRRYREHRGNLVA
ncbi:hypothetical protein CAOG_002828 [Capsaspora owczarzaki ATCC 30864]|uniref:Uncharacterized protein n=1 Tax=Capsaspora owczarzaki (strain ATCC 30864) TaxID=595528 RepID=A0A0D2WN40_CAPO3|nr:hypothetical protein CAOG_002828 [Capsaspora owczarzaki ATCC 30864]